MGVVLLVSAVAPAAVAAQSGSLSVDVTQDDETGDATVTVTSNGTAVENATVNVTTENGTYAGTGEYTTGANGTVSLPEPDESVTLTVAATDDGVNATTTVDIDPSLAVSIAEADDGSSVVTVTRGNDTVENATVNVTANTTYADAGEYATDANGTVALANPSEPVELTITATADNDTATTSVDVMPVETLAVGVNQADDGAVTVSVGRLGEPVANATVEVTATDNGTYAGAGEYETDESGTVVLPAPSENVTVTVTATEGGESATTTAELSPPEPTGPFGQVVSAFVDALKGSGFSGPLGQQVSEFVTNNNPSENASERGPPENAGPPADAGPDRGADEDNDGNETDDDGNESRIVPAGPPTESPGNSGSAAGQSDTDDAPGNSGSAPGQSDGEDADGEDDESEDASEDDSDDAPGNSGSAPGQSDDEDADGEDEESGDEERGTEVFEQLLRARIETTGVDGTYLAEYLTAVAKALDGGTESVPDSCVAGDGPKSPFDAATEPP